MFWNSAHVLVRKKEKFNSLNVSSSPIKYFILFILRRIISTLPFAKFEANSN